MPCDGEIERWEILSLRNDLTPVYLSIWRQEGGLYKLVGYNAVNATKTGPLLSVVPVSERIQVRQGDIVGLFYEGETSPGVVPYADANSIGGYSTSELRSCVSQRAFRQDINNQMASQGGIVITGIPVRRVYSWKAHIKGAFYFFIFYPPFPKLVANLNEPECMLYRYSYNSEFEPVVGKMVKTKELALSCSPD